MAKIKLEVGAVTQRGKVLALGAALALAASLWLGLSPPAIAKGTEWQTYLSEDFSGTESMYYTGKAGEANYAIDDQGRYVINGLDTDSDSLSALTDSMYYYYVESSCELVSSDAKNLAFVGLVFHYKKQDDGTLAYYVFYIYGDGYYGAKRVIGDKVDIALPLTKSDEIDVGMANVLAVEAQGSRFDLYINGKHVDGFTDLKLDGGGFGFYISKRSEGAFDNFKVKVEKRDTGQEPPEEPNSATDGAPTKFTSYSPPYIPKDPNRPVYPWEVGVDKSKKGKGKKPAEPAEQGARVEAAGDGQSSDGGKSGARQSEKKKPSGGNGNGSNVKPGAKKVEKPKAPPADETPSKPDKNDDEVGQSTGDGRQNDQSPSEESADTGSDDAQGSAPAPSVEILPPADNNQPLAPQEEQVPEPITPAPIEEINQSQPEPEPGIEVPEAPEPNPAKTSPPDAVPDEGSQQEPEQTAPRREPEPSPPPAKEEEKPFIRVEKEPARKPPADQSPSAEKPKPEKQAAAAKPAADPAEKMRGRQDDWSDPNSDSAVVQEIRPPAPASKDAPPHKQAVPKQDSAKMELPAPPGEEAKPEAKQAAAEKKPVEEELPPAPAPKEDKTSAGELALLPPAEETTAPVQQPDAPAQPQGETAVLPTPSDPTKLDDLPQVERGEAPVVDLQAPPAPASEPQPPPAIPEPAPPAPATELPPAAPLTQQPAPATPLDPNMVLVEDDFSQPRWAVADSPTCSYRYFGAAYEINNLNSATMALSFQQETLAAVEAACDVEFLDGVSYVGYGLAARFSAKDGVPTYYGLFVCQSGEYMLLRVLGGQETILTQWTASPQLNPNKPNRIKLTLAGTTISAYINNELVATVTDDAIPAGGYALLAGPGVSARFDNFSLRGTR